MTAAGDVFDGIHQPAKAEQKCLFWKSLLTLYFFCERMFAVPDYDFLFGSTFLHLRTSLIEQGPTWSLEGTKLYKQPARALSQSKGPHVSKSALDD